MRPAVVTTKLSTFTARFSTRTRRRHLSGVHAQRERSIGAGSNQCGGARLPPPPVSRRGQPLWLRAPHGTKSFVNCQSHAASSGSTRGASTRRFPLIHERAWPGSALTRSAPCSPTSASDRPPRFTSQNAPRAHQGIERATSVPRVEPGFHAMSRNPEGPNRRANSIARRSFAA